MKVITCIFNDFCKAQVDSGVYANICVCGQIINRSKQRVIFTAKKNGFDLTVEDNVDDSDCLFIL